MLRDWAKFTGKRSVGGFLPSYFGPLSHVRAGMLTFMENAEQPGRLGGNRHAIVLCYERDAEFVKSWGHDACVVSGVTPRERFWQLFQEHAKAGEFERAGYRIDETAKLQSGSWVGVAPFKVIELDGRRQLACHVGGVKIGKGSMVGSTSTVQCGIYGEYTELGDEVFIDNRVHVGHGTIIGDRTTVTAGAVLGAWLEIGDDVWIGVGAVIREHVKIGDGAVIGMGAVVLKDVPAGVTVVGNPARPLEK